MASSFQKSLDKFAKGLQEILSARRIAEVRRVLAAECLSIIQRRTRSGRGVSGDEGTVAQLKPLSPRYIEFRRRNGARLSAFTSPGKSNLTFGGSLLRSMALRTQGQSTFITFIGRHESGISNAKLAEYVQNDRPFFHLSRDEKEQAQRRAIVTFEDLAKRGLATLR